MSNPLTKEESRHVYNCDGERLSGSTTCWSFKTLNFKVSLKYIREFHTPVCYCGDISTPRNMTLNETSCDWLFDMSVKRPHGRGLTNGGCHLFQTFTVSPKGLATRDYKRCDYMIKTDRIIPWPIKIFCGQF